MSDLAAEQIQSAEQIQAAYYKETAGQYDAMHNSAEDHEHNAALSLIDSVSGLFHLESFLDVGSGTGRAVEYLAARGKNVKGIEPVAELIEAGERRGVPKGAVIQGSGYKLPFEDGSIDAVMEFGILHHVAEPGKVIAEMMRVARKAVFLSDCNRFGQGSMPARLVKLALYKAKLWNAARYVQTKGKMYSVSEGDGLYYSYSVYDTYPQLAGWADKMWMVPLDRGSAKHPQNWLHPLLTCSVILVCAMKDEKQGSGVREQGSGNRL
jgi:ubiquinone/menaquinone biosynthesis C-methylase UbiE